ncbi:MAG TPA: HEPN domain-containing protein [Chitinophaga sp.]|uniref:HEPN domain-containing protein n=1 Tax=Chitinophaga sp. TaxID=1869181 RepID=UPI002BC7B334|nr:HEPN domain-containing protein [Chitinophaga sp.]HVI48983.1 HEPN domain-containing protein [Chitinophaga sp.]
MKTSLDHLPKEQFDQLSRIVQTIIHTISISPEKIILLDKDTLSKWIGLPQTESHYDILIITGMMDIEHPRHELDMLDTMEAEYNFNVPVNIMTYSIDFVNTRLRQAHYFFSEIINKGTLLFDAGNTPLTEIGIPSGFEKQYTLKKTKESVEKWLRHATKLTKAADGYLNENDPELAMFMLHQSAIYIYNAAILVFLGYTPDTHNLETLRRICRHFSVELANVFKTKEEYYDMTTRMFNNYTARSHMVLHFIIDLPNVLILADKVKELQSIADRLCHEKITFLETVE